MEDTTEGDQVSTREIWTAVYATASGIALFVTILSSVVV